MQDSIKKDKIKIRFLFKNNFRIRIKTYDQNQFNLKIIRKQK
jgi:hypothetical protein